MVHVIKPDHRYKKVFIYFLEQVLQHSSRNNGISDHEDVHFHFHKCNHKATRVICGSKVANNQ